jgi:predicted ATPase
LRPDLEPGASLIDLGVYRLIGLTTPERIFQIAYPNQPTVSFAPLHAEYATASHLPLPVSRFFGRERELSRLLDLLALPQTRLVTLTGPGGTGKTRLALETARRLVDRYSGAVWFVPLGELVRDDLLTTAVSDAIGVARSAGQDPFTLVVTALAAQPCLLVLDNLEHLLAPAAVWLTDLLARVPTCTCLATSRERLNLDGELELPIATLPVPSVTKEVRRQEVGQQEGVDHPSALFSFPSVALFVDRCQTVQPEFHLTADNAEAVAALCAGLEGLPLAIELAAARAQVATPAQMVTMLSRRFDLLVSRRRDLSARHRTMRATIEWSYNLLAPELQQFFRRLSVFRGGWSLEAAETVCEEPLALDALAQLREGSLIITEEAAGEMRFGMMETLREYAQEQLGRDAERARTVQRHQEWCVALAEAAAPQLLGPQQRRFLEQLEREHDNIRAAFARCRESAEGVETDLRLVGSLWLFWYIRAHVREGRDQCATALARSGTDAFVKARASALNGAGNLCVGQDPAQARAYHEECLALRRELGDLRGVAGSLNNLGNAAVYSGDYPAARSYFEQALTINQTTGNRTLEAGNLHNLGEIAREEGNTEAATEYFKAALTINEETGNGAWKASNLNGLAHMAKLRGDLSGALTDHDAALSIYRSLGDRVSEAYTLFLLGGVAELAGDLEAARGHYERALAINRETGDANWERRNLDSLARIAAIESGKKSG